MIEEPTETELLKARVRSLEEENEYLRAESRGAEKLLLVLSEKHAKLRLQHAITETDRDVCLRALRCAESDLEEFKRAKKPARVTEAAL